MLEFVFQLDPPLLTYVVDHLYTQFLLARRNFRNVTLHKSVDGGWGGGGGMY